MVFTIRKNKTGIRTELCSAMSSRQVIRFYYHGGLRCVEPYCYGELAYHTESLLCYQIHGHYEYGGPTGWKLFRASEITNLEVTPERFNPFRREDDTGYDSRFSLFESVDCRVVGDMALKDIAEELNFPEPDEGKMPDFINRLEYPAPVADHDKPVNTIPGPADESEIPDYAGQLEYPAAVLGHNELMRRFRLSHPVPV